MEGLSQYTVVSVSVSLSLSSHIPNFTFLNSISLSYFIIMHLPFYPPISFFSIHCFLNIGRVSQTQPLAPLTLVHLSVFDQCANDYDVMGSNLVTLNAQRIVMLWVRI